MAKRNRPIISRILKAAVFATVHAFRPVGSLCLSRFYRITASGRRQLQVEHDSWRKISLAINQVLERAIALAIVLTIGPG